MVFEKLIKYVDTLESGARPKGGASEFTDESIPSLGAEHLNDNGGFKFDKIKYIPESFYNQMDSGLIKTNDILIVKDGATTGKISHVNNTFPFQKAAINEHVFLLRLNEEKAYPSFIFHYLKTETGQKEIMKDFRGATVGGISRRFIELVNVPVLPLQDQIRIADILSRIESLIAKRKESIQLLDDLVKSVFLDMFGDPVRNEKGWELLSLSSVVNNENSKRIPIKQDERDKRKGSYPYFGATGIIDMIDDYKFEGEFLLIAEDGKNLLFRRKNNAFIAKGKFWVNNHAHVLSFNGVCSLKYLEFFLNNIDLNPFLTGIDQVKLNKENLDRIPVPTPPVELQNKFASVVVKVEATKVKYRKSLSELEALYGSLSQRAFKGEL